MAAGGSKHLSPGSYQNDRNIKLSFFALQKIAFLLPNCPTLAKNALIRGFRKNAKAFFKWLIVNY
jgi:hypothetical protein